MLLLLGVLTASVVVVVNIVIQRRDRRRIRSAEQAAVDAQEALTTTLNGALAPITSYLGEMGVAGDLRQRATIGGKVRQAVVDAAVRLTVSTARSAFYRLDAATGSLVLDVYGGRSTLPREHFAAGDEVGDVLLDLVARGDLVFVPDVAIDRLVTPTTPGEYATVIAVAVTAGPDSVRTAHGRRPGGRPAHGDRRRARTGAGEPARLGSGPGAGGPVVGATMNVERGGQRWCAARR